MVTLSVVPYAEIESLTSVGRIRKLLNIAKQNRIVLLQGRLEKEEEAELIQATMEEINEDFRGIELAVINPQEKDANGVDWLRNEVAGLLLGNRTGLTIIGPSSIVKDIKRDPHKIELLTKRVKPKARRKR